MNEQTLYSTRGPVDHEVRSQIVAAATEHFSLYGYDKTTISDIARAIGFSKAYIYRFFASKQAIGELICGNCLGKIEADIRAAVDAADSPSEKLRRMFKAAAETGLHLHLENRKLYDIAASATIERWETMRAFDQRIQAILQDILRRGRETEEFERKTPLDETTMAIHLVLRSYLNPLILQYNLEFVADAPGRLSSLVLRSLSP